jgi:predicted negative regulator of RcsB-dependent stress response
MTRHELKAQDEITSRLQTFSDTAYEKKNQILTGVAIILVLAAGVVGWRWYSQSRTAAAQAQLGAVISAFTDPSLTVEKERYEKTIAEARKTIDAYGATQSAAVAKYYIGLSQDGLGQKEEAVRSLQEAVDTGDAGVKPVAQFALAGILRKNGENQKAIEVLKQLEEAGGYSPSAVAYELAVSYEAGGQQEQAQTYYTKVITDYPQSTFREASEVYFKMRGLPVPVPAPPPPALPPVQ